jgi:hypothetical protein
MNPAHAQRLRLYKRERPRRGQAEALKNFDAALELIEIAFILADRLTGADFAAVTRLRWAARQIMKTARRRARGETKKKRVRR